MKINKIFISLSFIFCCLGFNVKAANENISLDDLRNVSLSTLQEMCPGVVKDEDKVKCSQLGKSELQNLLMSSMKNYNPDDEEKRQSYRLVINELNQSTLYSEYMQLCDALKGYFPKDANCNSIPDCEDSSIGEISRMAKKCVGISTVVSSDCADWFYDEIYNGEIMIYLDLRYVRNLYNELKIPLTEDGYNGDFLTNKARDNSAIWYRKLSNRESDLAELLSSSSFDYNRKFAYIVNKLSAYDPTVKDRINEQWIKSCITNLYDNNSYIKARAGK